jgi:DNA invertase Pin-like site-specific DNA recombinase
MMSVKRQRMNISITASKDGLEVLKKAEVKVKNRIDYVKILELKFQGLTQLQIAQTLNISITSVTRIYRKFKKERIQQNLIFPVR